MINFEELRIGDSEPLDRDKWNGLLDWVVENPFNLTDQKVSLTHPESDLTLNVEAQRDFGLLETPDGKPLSINPGRSRVGIGTTTPEAPLQIVNQNQDANGGTLVLGPQSQSNLRLGYHSGYSWIQSHGLRPLAINPLGNNVGIGTTNPAAPLHVAGSVRTDFITLGPSLGKNKLSVYQAADGSSHYGMGVTAGHFYFNIGNPQAQFSFLNSAQDNAAEIVIITGAGNVHARDFIKTSDAQVKKDIRPFDDGLEIVEQLSPVAYQYNGLGNTVEGPEEIGLIAQDLEAVAPYLVSKLEHKLHPGDEEKTELLTIKPMTIIYLLVNAVKELSRKVEELEAQIA